ncbi:MAG: TIR domain-containing protein [Oligoflexia bacterium]|nr:TIR domain-containing protein [Oligoflexia bacterium]
MARKVFFSFKYEDVSRAMVVRNSWVTQGAPTFQNVALTTLAKGNFDQIKKNNDGKQNC